MMLDGARALVFDVFGTVVTGAAGRRARLRRYGAPVADAWRRRYALSMEEVHSGRRPFTRLDVLQRENLEATLAKFGVDPTQTPTQALDELNLAWHRLDSLPDALAGLVRLKTRYIIAPLSNGNIPLLLDMAKRAGIPWDAILGAEVAQAYKSTPEAYLRTVDVLALQPQQVCLVAAHNSDLAAARACGLRTAFIPRPFEHGPLQTSDVVPAQDRDVVAQDFGALAGALGL